MVPLPRVEPDSPANSSPSSGGAQALVCPHCQGSIRARQVEVGHQLRCSSCRGHLGGPATGPIQWLYPEVRRLDSSLAGRRVSSPDTLATVATPEAYGSPVIEVGQRRIGRYELREELGRGGMGAVYAAWDEELRREVALKVLLTGGFASAEARARFAGEARAAAGLHHVHIVRVFDMGEVDGQPWFAMERVFGPSLEDILGTGGALPIEEATRIGLAVADAVANAHAAGVAHRDLKPGNVLLDGDGHPRITDFGLARQLEDTQQLTATHQVLGTPSYMPPEVARADRQVDWIRADVYGLGGVLYAALTGGPPVKGATLAQRLEAASRGDHHSPRRARADVPLPLDAIVGKALHPDPASRYPHAAALADDLRRFRDGQPVSARPDTTVERAGRWSRGHARSLAAAAVGTLVVAVAAAWAPVQGALATRQREAAAAQAWAGIEADLGSPEGEGHLQAFVESEQFRGTTAVARAWLRKGDDLAKLPHPHGELGVPSTDYVDAWARALTESRDPTLRAAALSRMARDARLRASPTDLAAFPALVRAIEELPAGSLPEAELLPLQLDAALQADDRERAAALWDRAVALGLPQAEAYEDPRWLPDAFRHATPIPGTTYGDELADDRDPHGPAVIHLDERTVSRIALVPRIALTATAPLAAPRPHAPREARPALTWGEEGLVDAPPGNDRVWGDVDGDGVAEGYEWFRRVLYRIAPDGRSREPILPEVIRTNSELTHTVADLDGDGRAELIVALGEWRAYDLRVYDVVDGSYRLRARLPTQDTLNLATLPDPWGPGRLLVSAEDDHYSNGARFGVDTPDGPAMGIVIRRLVGDQLEEVYALRRDSGVARLAADVGLRALVADLDGDGRDEVIRPTGGGTVVLRSTPTPGQFRAAFFDSPEVRWAAQLDDDPAMELVAFPMRQAVGDDATAPSLWILGRGDAPLPPVAEPELPDPLVPPDGALEGPLASVWRDAQVLSRAHRDHTAASLLLRSAGLARDPTLATAASGLWRGTGRPGAAAAAMELAARESAPGPEAEERWGKAVRLWLDAADPAAALAAAERWRAVGEGPGGEIAARLAVWEAARAHSVGLVPGAVPDAAWEVDEPLAVELGAERTVLHLLGDGGAAIHAPVRPLGGGIALLVDGVVDPMEAGIVVGLDATRGFAVRPHGDDQAGALLGRCLLQDRWRTDLLTLPPAGTKPPAAIPVRLRLTWTPEDGAWRCVAALPEDGQEVSQAVVGTVPETMSLAVRADANAGRWAALTVQRLEVWGVAPTTQAPTPVQQANRALLRQDPAAALSLLPHDALLERAVAYAQLRRAPEAIALFREAIAHDPDALVARLPYLARLRRETFAPLLRPAVGDRWPALLDGALHEAIRQVYRPRGVEEALRVELEGVPFPRDPADPGWCILADRVGALARGPDPARGVEAGRAWLAAFAALNVPRDTDPWALASQVHRELAFEAAARGDREAAMAEAQASVDVSPTPVIAVDRVGVSPIWQASGFPLPVARPHD